jgi:hypothetical protein
MDRIWRYEVVWYKFAEEEIREEDIEDDEKAIAFLTDEIQQAFEAEVGLMGFFDVVKRQEVEKIGD